MLAEQIHADFDLRYNYRALQLAVVAPDFMTPEQAVLTVGITKLHKQTAAPIRHRFTQRDIEAMIRMRGQGVTWRELEEIYGASRQALFDNVKRFKQRKEAI